MPAALPLGLYGIKQSPTLGPTQPLETLSHL